MRPIFVDSALRRRVLATLCCTFALVAVCAVGSSVLGAGVPRLILGTAAVAALLWMLGDCGVAIQRGLLGRGATAGLRTRLAWTGAFVGAVAGPLITAKLTVAGVALASGTVLPVEGAGALAGVGVAGMVLPMALLVAGTAAMKLPASAVGAPIDAREAIRLVEGREWSLLPLGFVLALTVLAIGVGTVAGVFGMLPGLGLLAAGLAAFPAVVAATARRWRALQPAR